MFYFFMNLNNNLNKLLNKKWSCWLFEMPWCSCDIPLMWQCWTAHYQIMTNKMPSTVNNSLIIIQQLMTNHFVLQYNPDDELYLCHYYIYSWNLSYILCIHKGTVQISRISIHVFLIHDRAVFSIQVNYLASCVWHSLWHRFGFIHSQ